MLFTVFMPWETWPISLGLLDVLATTRLTPSTCPAVDLLPLSIYCCYGSQPLLRGLRGPTYIAGLFDLCPTEFWWAPVGNPLGPA